jgi:hypothetical protein
VSDLSDRADAYWDFFISECARQKAPLYVRFSAGVRDDAYLRGLAALAHPGQPMANLLFGAVHYLLLRGADHPLRDFYKTLNGHSAVEDADPFPLFREFCLSHEADVAALIAARSVGTNEVGRAAYLHAGFLTLAAEAEEPLHVIELGPSAGLNMHWDCYRYLYRKDGARYASGDRHGAFELETELAGDDLPPFGASPRVGQRLGLERDPLDLAKAEDRDWLRALVWPDHPERLRRLEHAQAAARTLPAEIRRGDALDLLPDALAESPPRGAVCVFHTMVTYQFATEARQALDDLLRLASVRRPVWRLSMELMEGDYPLVLAHYTDGAVRSRVLALCNSQGGTLEWRA